MPSQQVPDEVPGDPTMYTRTNWHALLSQELQNVSPGEERRGGSPARPRLRTTRLSSAEEHSSVEDSSADDL